MKRLLFLFATALTLCAQKWPAIPADAWDPKVGPGVEAPAAVVIENQYTYRRKGLERFRRVLVLNHAGRQFAELTLVGERFTGVKGRTLLPDGREIPFTEGGDVFKHTRVKVKDEEVQAIRIIPAGLEDRCLVDISWFEPQEGVGRPIHEDHGLNLTTSFSEEVPVRLAQVVVAADVIEFEWVRKVEVPSGLKWKETHENGATIYRFEDIPARPKDTLASNADLRLPVLHWFWSPDMNQWMLEVGFQAGVPVSAFDAYSACVFYELLVNRGPSQAFKRKLDGILEGLPSEDGPRAEAVIRRLRARVKTLDELGEQPSAKAFRKGTPEHAFERGWGNPWQINMLAFYALRGVGLNPALVYVIDREENRYSDATNLWQYDHVVIALPDGKGGFKYFDPGSTYYPMGLRPWFQASKGMLIQPGRERRDWKGRLINTPMTPAAENRHLWKAEVTLGEDATYQVAYQGTGQASSQVRSQLNRISREPLPALKGLLESSGFRVNSVIASNSADSWSPMAFSVQGALDLEEGRKRAIHPFPFIPAPFPQPEIWPNLRAYGIHFPMAGVVEAETILPWKANLGAPERLDRRNSLGEVRWVAEPIEEGRRLKVSLAITVKNLVGGAFQYGDLKDLGAWITDARSRRIGLP